MELSIIYRILLIFLGATISYLSFKVITNKGFRFFSYSGITLGIWAIIQTLLHLFYPNANLLMITSIICWFLIGIFLPLGFVVSCKIFQIDLIKYYTRINLIIFYGFIWVILLIVNLMQSYTILLREILGVSHLIIPIMFTVTLYPAFKLANTTGKGFFKALVAFLILTIIGTAAGSYTGGCCLETQDPILIEACTGFSVNNGEVIPLPCPAGLVKYTKYYNLVTAIGIIIAIIAYFRMWKTLKAINY